MKTIDLRIHPTELHGLPRLLEMLCLRPNVMRSHGMEPYGSLEVKEQIVLRIRLTE
jgi:hypothetical protein